MSSLTRSAGRKPTSKPAAKPAAPVAPMTDAERKSLKSRFLRVAVITLACCVGAFMGIVGSVTLHHWWGLPLFVLSMIGGFGSQIAFIVGLVKANRTDKGV